ncbi:MAG: transglutaminase family protein [Sphingobium sp.]|nr:transglutaminase family protein [Sphingobium sp.]
MKIAIRHSTHYYFDQPVPYALQRLRLMPKDSAGQQVIHWTMKVEGGVCEAEYDDACNNHVALIRVESGVEEVHIECTGEVETDAAYHGIVGRHRGYTPLWFFRQSTPLTKVGHEINAIVSRVKASGGGNDIKQLHALSAEILNSVDYVVGATHATTTAEEAAKLKQGVCQDHAHIFLAAARQLGYPARYVSGYLYMDDRPEQEAGHAWAEAWVEALGWVGFDISNGISPDERYIRVATGRDYAEAAPIHSMSFGARDQQMIVRLRIDQQ